ncbi:MULTISPECIES: cytochrome c [unclassified Shewanella]|uniref:c-type cytochrome n=1 Tax=unclassified Shewanella TaxID=196818 RepID=UPI000C8644FC|nr:MULTISPECIES: cytochrome c [unclassified Shewanella]MDO6617517.1 cytochrome c [Shewanella sp. 6_MG-2023]MDO6638751.1 cytochrome c [Shewanella sp. 5_MG-2023]MDO6679847.1 cytochrome c [Shewanella sp. 4_MG-2023]MDO6773769.1 cytochrome c [Shewanella sp. 3_MG-2023]PMG43177.1 cytochrome C [Shewanella sp. 10N.286.52.B9]
MKNKILALAVSALLIPTVNAHNFEDANDAIDYRKAGFSLIRYQFGDMAAMMKGKKEFELTVFQTRAANLAALAKIPHEGFIAGSDNGDTEALAKIWSNKADFDTKMTEFQENAVKLDLAAQTGDKKQIKQAFGNTGKSCKGCHDMYKKD